MQRKVRPDCVCFFFFFLRSRWSFPATSLRAEAAGSGSDTAEATERFFSPCSPGQIHFYFEWRGVVEHASNAQVIAPFDHSHLVAAATFQSCLALLFFFFFFLFLEVFIVICFS